MAARLLTATFTPAAAAYLANDVMEGAKEFVNAGQPGSVIRIRSADLLISHTALVASEANYRLALYNVTPPSALADNAAWDIPSGDRDALVALFSLGTPVDVGSSLFIQAANLNIDVKLDIGSSLFGYLITDAGITPTAAARRVRMFVE
jgi:hypothetical protein